MNGSLSSRRRVVYIVASTGVATLLGLAVFLVLGLSMTPQPAWAQGSIIYVDDDTCPTAGSGTQLDPYCRIQTAVDAASGGDEIRVATGLYTGTLEVTAHTGYTYKQVVIITKSLALRGGYAPGAWDTPDPEANSTIVDAQRDGRGISIVGSGTESVTVEGLIVTGGDYTGLGNGGGVGNAECGETSFDCGGGLYAYDVVLSLGTTVITDNVAGTNGSAGGGIYLYDLQAGSRLDDVTVISNTARGSSSHGGGLCVRGGYEMTIARSEFEGNSASSSGGGMYVFDTDGLLLVEQSNFRDNHTWNVNGEDGAGLSAWLTTNGEALRMDRVQFLDNQAWSSGAAIYLKKLGSSPTSARLTNLFLAGNDTAGSESDEAVVAIGHGYDFVTTWAHVTAADNQVPTFLHAEAPYNSDDSLEVVLTNTIVTSFTYGFVGDQGASNGDLLIRHTRCLTHQVDTLHHAEAGSPIFQAISTVAGDPKLVNGYQLDKGSAAEDAGIEAGVDVDIRGKYRPQKVAPDIGCYEGGALQLPVPLGINGPTTAAAGAAVQFVAVVSNTSATRPITYVWEATGLDPVTHTLRGFSDTVGFTWPATGPQVVTATARNVVGQRVVTHTLDVLAIPALSIVKTGPDQVLIGTSITCTLMVTNAGLVTASDLVITDALPAGAHYVSGGTPVGDVISWTVPSLAGNDGSVEVTFVVTAGQTITNADYRVEANGGYSATGAVPLVTRNVYPMLTIVKQGPYSADVGEEIDYLLTITNTGTGPATDLVITDTLPAGAHYVTGGTRVGDVISWTVDSLAGYSGTVEVGFTVTATQIITNADYRASASGGFGAVGADPVVTIVSRGTRYVAPSGSDGFNDCTDSDAPCATIQHAVDLANRDEEVRVAGGTYTGTHRAQPTATRAFTQVVYVDDGLTLRGGYAVDDWETSDPQANETIIDAEGYGRGVTIYYAWGNRVTLDGFTITGGDYTGLGNPLGENDVCFRTSSDCGGGLFVRNSTVTIRNSVITGNVASRDGSGRNGDGGGIYLWAPRFGSRIENTHVIGNSANENHASGGGVYVYEGYDLTVDGCIIQGNYAWYEGAGMTINQPNRLVNIQDTDFFSNTQHATSGYGGGGLAAQVSYAGEALRLERVRFAGNVAHAGGGAIFLDTVGSDGKQVRLNNLLLAGNRTPSGDATDAVVAVARSYRLDLTLAHVTAADNPAPTFLRAEAPQLADNTLNVVLTNTLVSSATYAFVGSQPIGDGSLFITHTRTLTHDVGTLHYVVAGSPAFHAVDPLGGDPLFDADHHLQPTSPARDAGIDAGVALDVDGDARIDGSPDVGADEVEEPGLAVAKWADPGSVETGERLTYTLWVTNTGNVELHATVTDTLPTQVTPGGELVWTPTITVPGGVWIEQVVVTAPTDYAGELANVVQAVAAEGVSGVYTETSTVISGCTGLTGVDFDWAPATPAVGSPVQFTAWVTPAQPASYVWDLGGQAAPTGNPVSHTFVVSDTYTIVVTATNGCGAPVQAEHAVSVESRYAVYLPLVLRNP